MSKLLSIRLGQKVKSKTYWGVQVKEGDVGIITKIETHYQGDNMIILYTLNIQFGGYTLVLKKEPKYLIDMYLENYEEPNDVLDSMRYGLEYMKRKTPIDTTTRFSSEPFKLPEQIREDLDKITAPKLEIPFRKNYMSFAGTTLFQENINEVLDNIRNYGNNKGEKEMIGLPYSVNFVEKHKRTTLVWKNFKITNHMSMSYHGEENYETTKSEAHNEKFSHLYGFLMAYFKRVHQGKSKTQIKKYLNAVVYPMSKMSQLAFLQGVFYENCGLDYKEAKAYLQKIEKGESVNAETK